MLSIILGGITKSLKMVSGEELIVNKHKSYCVT